MRSSECSNQSKTPLPVEFRMDCPACKISITLDDLISDPVYRVLGMNVDHHDPTLNFYYFNHETAHCGTTFVVPVEYFSNLVEEPIPDLIRLGESSCPDHCVRLDDKADCSHHCHWAPFRRFLRVLIERKAAAQSS